ncbi:MAG: helix-turn-helix domain-containing protein [Clostridia bacterium]|nr:helix-turn-helix domain-containing protein [Clostridia bacterium]
MPHEQSQIYNAVEAKKQNLVGKRIAAIRKARKLTQADVCDALKRYGISIQPAALSRWESGVTEPNAVQFLALYRVFNLRPDFRFLEDDITPLEVPLSEKEVRLVRQFTEYLEDQHIFESKRENIRELCFPLMIPHDRAIYPNTPVPYTYSQITVKETDIPYGADFALRVSDNTMLPDIKSGDILFCSYTKELLPKDIGIFIYQNELFIRRYFTYPGNEIPIVLYPADMKYPAIPVDSADELTILARVLI